MSHTTLTLKLITLVGSYDRSTYTEFLWVIKNRVSILFNTLYSIILFTATQLPVQNITFITIFTHDQFPVYLHSNRLIVKYILSVNLQFSTFLTLKNKLSLN